MKRVCKIITLIIVSMLLTSCQTGREFEQLRRLHDRYESDITGNKHINEDDILDRGPEKGGTLKLFTTKPDTLNPVLTTNSYTADFLGLIYEGLTRLDENQRALPVLSDRWTVSDDGLIWEFHIRDGILWHDGESFTAYDVEFTIQTILNPSIDSPYKSLLLNVSKCVATDSSTVRIALKKPNSFTPEMMSFPIIPKHQFSTVDVLTASRDLKPVGTGPYRFVSYDGAENIMLTLYDDWWCLNADQNLKSEGMYIENIQVNIFRKAEDAMGAFQSGDVDVVGLELNEYLKYMGRTDLAIKNYASRNFEFITLNLNDPVLSDIYARRAIALSIDKQSIIKEVLRGAAVESELPVLPDCWLENSDEIFRGGGKDASSIDQESQKRDMTGGEDKTQADSGDMNDPDAAETVEEVLTLGGWKQNQQGYYKVIRGSRRYLTLDLLVNSNNSLRVRAAEMICSQLEEVGIKVNLIQLPWNDMLNRINSGKYKMAIMGCRVPQIPDISFMYSDGYLTYASSPRYSEAWNVSGYRNPEVDEYVSKLFGEIDEGTRKETYKALKDQVLYDCPYIGLYFLKDAMVYGKDVRGPLTPFTWDRFNGIYHWYKPAPW
ncbi:MAG: peptide ABC transporter substrate-binding protein [Bacillota bacterium]|nr:peptide ABC transporter substrate-binding protein [Bacillota bacterium]